MELDLSALDVDTLHMIRENLDLASLVEQDDDRSRRLDEQATAVACYLSKRLLREAGSHPDNSVLAEDDIPF